MINSNLFHSTLSPLPQHIINTSAFFIIDLISLLPRRLRVSRWSSPRRRRARPRRRLPPSRRPAAVCRCATRRRCAAPRVSSWLRRARKPRRRPASRQSRPPSPSCETPSPARPAPPAGNAPEVRGEAACGDGMGAFVAFRNGCFCSGRGGGRDGPGQMTCR